MKKHYYSNEGVLQYLPPEKIVLKLLNTILGIYGEKIEDPSVWNEVFIKSFGVRQGYEIHNSMAGLGGCLSLEEWYFEVDKDPIIQVLKIFVKDFAKEYLIEEFPWAVFGVICTMKMEILLNRNCSDEKKLTLEDKYVLE